MSKLVTSMLHSIFTFIFIINLGYSDDSITEEDIISTFKRSMMHWNVNYDKLERNKSGAACIPWNIIDKKYLNEEIFIALGYGFNLYDIEIATKAALEGCERMRMANKIRKTCKCEMIIYNEEVLIKIKNER